MGVFKTQLRKAYEFYPLAQKALEEERAANRLNQIRWDMLRFAEGGESKYVFQSSVYFLPYIEKFAEEEELTLEILPDPNQPDINVTSYIVTISGWAHDADARSQAGYVEGHGEPVSAPDRD